ncbi:hypothetical protein FOL47_004982 [Perkinsus chesapeaki]|uniref:Uncharacterized protein n=1 Tax=Perkinsus chesapeaki TaxID=330153 RepID=A0A7J6LZN6_PERCH|nr:hypothetical protein FOL47_004982 [Perkinsus chesapeaki]
MSSSNELILKLHTTEETLRVRVDAEKCKDMAQIKGYIEQAWPALKGKEYRIYYLDDFDEMCLLNDLSVGDAMSLPGKMFKSDDETAVPVLDLFIKTDADKTGAVRSAQEDTSARNLARWLTDFDYMNTFDDAWQLVDSMLATGQDLDSVARHLQNRQNQKQAVAAAPVAAAPAAVEAPRGEKRTASEMEKDDSSSKAIQPHTKSTGTISATTRNGDHEYHIERHVKSEKEAVDTMVDLLTEMGFVDSKDKAKELVNGLVGSGKDLQRVADHIVSRAIEQEQDSSRAQRDIANEMRMVDQDSTARDFADLLDDFGFVESRDAARELVGSLMATQQNLSRIADHFMRHARTTSLKGSKKVADAQKKAVGDVAEKKAPADSKAATEQEKTAF